VDLTDERDTDTYKLQCITNTRERRETDPAEYKEEWNSNK